MVVNLRRQARDQPCDICSRNDGSTVLAHLRVGGNAGTGIKPPDHHALRACFECHSYIDGRGRGDYKIMLVGYLRQVDRWIREGRLDL